MNSYELSRAWFDFCFENPEKISPNHTALYFFCIEHCNRLGWKEKFGLPMEMAKEAIGIKNYRTYSKAFNDLVDFGFIKIIERSKNQYSANIIAIVKNAKATTKATTKALDNAMQKHKQKQVHGIVGIDKPNNKEPNNNINIEFDLFWNEYDKKVSRPDCEKKWSKLKDEERTSIMAHIPKYKIAQPDKKYRKDPKTFLNQQSWNDELITTNDKNKPPQNLASKEELSNRTAKQWNTW